MTEWRAIPGWEGCYEVSDDGQVRSLDRRVRSRSGTRLVRGQALKPIYRNGYPDFMLWREGRGRIISAHRLVMLAFVGPPPDGHECLHGDNDRGNPGLDNLRYGTSSENQRDKRRHGTDPNVNRVRCPRRHLLRKPNLVRYQLKVGWRMCRACHQTFAYLKIHPELDFQAESDRRYAIIMDTGAARRDATESLAQVPAQRSAHARRAVARDDARARR